MSGRMPLKINSTDVKPVESDMVVFNQNLILGISSGYFFCVVWQILQYFQSLSLHIQQD